MASSVQSQQMKRLLAAVEKLEDAVDDLRTVRERLERTPPPNRPKPAPTTRHLQSVKADGRKAA